jgi:hypothetical protein
MSAINCLLAKAELGRVSKKAVEQVRELVENLKTQSGSKNAVEDLQIATKALETLERRYKQRLLGDSLHIKQLETIAPRLANSSASGFRKLQSFILMDEPTMLKHGYQGLSANEAIKARTNYYGSQLVDLISDLGPKGKLSSAVKQEELIEHLYFTTRKSGKESMDPVVRKGVADIVNVTRKGGEDYAKYGGNISIREDFALGSHHDPNVMSKLGKAQWVSSIAPLLDMAPLLEVGLKPKDTSKFLEQVYDNLITGGLVTFSDYLPTGLKSVANKRNHHRLLQLKDAKSWLEYHKLMGKEDLANQFEQYVHNIARDVGALETIGPRPEAFFRSMLKEANSSGNQISRSEENTLRQEFRYVLGQWDTALDPEIARVMGNVKAMSASALIGAGTTVDAVVSDGIGLTIIPKVIRGLPVLTTMHQQLRLLFKRNMKGDIKELAKMGYGFEAFADEAGALFRAIDTTNTSSWASGFARFNFKITGLTRVTNASKTANRISTANLLADAADGSLGKYAGEWTSGFGIGPEDFALYSKYKKNVNGLDIVDIAALMRDGHAESAHKIAAAVERSAEIASPTSNPAIAAMFESMKRSGKTGQVISSSVGTFQGYMGSFWEHHIRSIAHLPHGAQKAAMVAQMVIVLPALYTVSTMIRDMIAGKEPVLDSETILRGFARSNLLPIVGDYMFSAGQSFHGSITDRIAGIHIGLIAKGLKASKQLVTGEFGDAGQEVLNFLKAFIPGGQAWGVGIALQRIIFDQANSMMRGHKADETFRRQARTQEKRGGGHWWAPGETLPEFLK